MNMCLSSVFLSVFSVMYNKVISEIKKHPLKENIDRSNQY